MKQRDELWERKIFKNGFIDCENVPWEKEINERINSQNHHQVWSMFAILLVLTDLLFL